MTKKHKFYKNVRFFWILFDVFIVLSLIGMIFLINRAINTEGPLVLEFILYLVSSVAIFLAILGAINNIKLARYSERILKEIRTSVREIEELNSSNEYIKRKLHRDYKLSQDIAEALEEAGIVDQSEKDDITKKIKRNMRKTSNSTKSKK